MWEHILAIQRAAPATKAAQTPCIQSGVSLSQSGHYMTHHTDRLLKNSIPKKRAELPQHPVSMLSAWFPLEILAQLHVCHSLTQLQ